MNETAEKPASSVRSTSKNAAIFGPDGPSRISRVSLSWSTGASRAPPTGPIVQGAVGGVPLRIGAAGCGGEGGIRTPGRLRVSGFQDRRLQPLGHLSAREIREEE